MFIFFKEKQTEKPATDSHDNRHFQWIFLDLGRYFGQWALLLRLLFPALQFTNAHIANNTEDISPHRQTYLITSPPRNPRIVKNFTK
jgi:hypothetical protein